MRFFFFLCARVIHRIAAECSVCPTPAREQREGRSDGWAEDRRARGHVQQAARTVDVITVDLHHKVVILSRFHILMFDAQHREQATIWVVLTHHI